MAVLKKIVLALLFLCALLALAFYVYLQSLPTGAPQFVSEQNLQADSAPALLACQPQAALNVAYDVTVTVSSELNQQPVYDSRLRFKTQLSQANDDVVKGLADNISVNEGDGDRTLQSVLFLSRIENSRVENSQAEDRQFALFNAYNDLGLVEQHPMAVLSQLLKALSVGDEQQNYFFSYDPMKRTYRYRHQPDQPQNPVVRAAYPTTANPSALMASFSDYQSDWLVTLGPGCLPQSLVTTERQALFAAGKEGFISFRIEAQQIPVFADINDYDFTAYANSGNQWNVKAVDGDALAAELENEQQMWNAVAAFDQNRDMAALRQAANYMFDHFNGYDAAQVLLDPELDDALKRDLIFALSTTGREDAEQFMLEVLAAMPVQAGVAADLQKVRMMVSIASNGELSSQSFDALHTLASDPAESRNVKNNALISMGTTLNQLQEKGEGSDTLRATLKEQVSQTIEQGGNASASAILAAGNAQLSGLEQPMQAALTSANSKERYAAASVLSRVAGQQQLLIEHIATEQSDLVTNAILANWERDRLTDGQRLQLQQIADNSTGQKAQMIERFLNP